MDAGPVAPPRPPALRVRRCLRRPWRFTRIGPAAPRMSGWPGEVGQVRPRRRTPGGGSDSAARAPGVRALISTLGGLPGLGGADQPGDRPAGRSRVGGGAGGHRVGAPHRPPALRGCRSATKMSHFQALKMSRSGAGRIGGRMDRVEFRGRPPAPKPGEGVECETDPLHRPARRGRVGGGAGGHRAGAALGLRRSGGSGVCIGLRAVQPISAGCAPVDRPGGRGRVAAAGPVDSERGLRSRGPDFRTAVRGERRPPAARCRGAARSLSRSPDGGLRARPAAATTGFENRATATGPARFGLAVAWRFERFGLPPHSRPPLPHCPPGSSTPAPLPDTLVSGSIAVLTAGSNTAAPPPVTLRWGSPLPGPPVRASRSGPPPHTARRGRAARRIEHPRLRRPARSFPAPAPPRPGVEYAGSGTGHAPPGLAVAGAAGSSLAVRPAGALPPAAAAPLAGSRTPALSPGASFPAPSPS